MGTSAFEKSVQSWKMPYNNIEMFFDCLIFVSLSPIPQGIFNLVSKVEDLWLQCAHSYYWGLKILQFQILLEPFLWKKNKSSDSPER